MSNVFVQFADDTKQRITSSFCCAQDPTSFPNQGQIVDTDPRYQEFINPASALVGAQAAQIVTLNSAYNVAIQGDVSYMGTTFQADTKSQDALAKSVAPGAVPSGFYWLDAYNAPVAMTFAQLQGLAMAMLTQGQAAFVKLQGYKTAVRAATTIAAVQAIVWA